MRSFFFACCETSIVDGQSNNLSVINVIEEIQAVSFPFFYPKFTIVVSVERSVSEPEDVATKLRLSLDDSTIAELDFTLKFQGKLRTRTLGSLQGLVIPAPGILKAEVRLEESVVASWEIRVSAINAPQLDGLTMST